MPRAKHRASVLPKTNRAPTLSETNIRPNWHERRKIYAARGDFRITGRTEQMNLRVRPQWKAQLIDIAEAHRCTMIEILERAVELYRRAKEAEARPPQAHRTTLGHARVRRRPSAAFL